MCRCAPLLPNETRKPIRCRRGLRERGFAGTSMRVLTTQAGVNLAAVNYHFGSRDTLLKRCSAGAFDPMNLERVAAPSIS